MEKWGPDGPHLLFQHAHINRAAVNNSCLDDSRRPISQCCIRNGALFLLQQLIFLTGITLRR
jgi:hypothetical protein